MQSPKKRKIRLATLLLASALAVPTLGSAASDNSSSSMNAAAKRPIMPAVNGFINGRKMLFMHTAVSDAGVAKILTDMMGGSPVLVIPSLAKAPAEMLAPVYAFTNGYSGKGPMGPLGGQPDIFDKAPGEAGYSPLHQIIVVTWAKGAGIVPLTSYAALKSRIDSGAISAKVTKIVANMPFLTWPGGKR